MNLEIDMKHANSEKPSLRLDFASAALGTRPNAKKVNSNGEDNLVKQTGGGLSMINDSINPHDSV